MTRAERVAISFILVDAATIQFMLSAPPHDWRAIGYLTSWLVQFGLAIYLFVTAMLRDSGRNGNRWDVKQAQPEG